MKDPETGHGGGNDANPTPGVRAGRLGAAPHSDQSPSTDVCDGRSVAGALSLAPSAFAQQSGGILKVGWFDSPASMSILEESTIAAERPMMGVFNNLVMYKQDVRQNSPSSIVPDLATGWTWNQEGTELTLPLRHDVKWHDGKPFTAADVRCTFELLQGTASEKLRIRANPGTRTSLRSRRRATTRSPFI